MVVDNSSLKQAGHYELRSFFIENYARTKKIDLKMVIHNFKINESMSSGSVYGSALVFDTQDIIDRFPITGEEIVTITYSDFFGKYRTETYFLFAIDQIDYADDKSSSVMKYMIHFVSIAKAFSETNRVQKAYKPQTIGSGLISDYVKDVFDEYYRKEVGRYGRTVKNIDIEETFGPQTFVIPRLTPEQTMMFFSRRAYTTIHQSQTFRFFENRDQYFFATNDYLLKKAKDANTVIQYSRNYKVDMQAERQVSAMNELIDVNFNERVNTIEDINFGGYKRRAYEIDIMNNSVTAVEYDHLSQYKEESFKLPHSSEFIDQRITKVKEQFLIKDYSSVGAPEGPAVRPNTYYPEVYNAKLPYFYHFGRNTITATVYGRNDLVAGGIVKLNLEVHKSDTEESLPDKEASGYYFVESIENIFYENTYRQKLTLSRGGLGT